MPFIGNKPSAVPLTAADITDSIITSAKIVDGTIANADINSSAAIALSKLSTTGTASSANFLRGDGAWSSAGITEADQWRISANHTITYTGEFVTANWERVDTDGFDKIGTGMSQSSGVFTFPSTGYWLIIYNADFSFGTTDNVGTTIYTTTDNSTYSEASAAYASAAAGYLSSASCSFIFDVTNTTNCKVKFYTSTGNSGNQTLMANTNYNQTHVTWIKLGET